MLTWTESNNIEIKKLEDLFGKIRAKFLSLDADKQKRSYQTASKQANIIESGIIEKGIYNSNIEAEDQNPKSTYGEEGLKFDFDAYK